MNHDLHKYIYYDTGTLFWKNTIHNKCQKDSPIGSPNNLGYLRVQFQKKRYYVHRIIWEMFNGPIPIGYEIDHIDGNPANNQIENLRLLTHHINLHSARKLTRNTSGILGVCWDKHHKKYEASVTIQGKRFRKLFECLNEAKEFVMNTKQLVTGNVQEGGKGLGNRERGR